MSLIVCEKQTSELTSELSYPCTISVLLMVDIPSLRNSIPLIRMQPQDQVILEVMIMTYVVTNTMNTRATTHGDPNVPIIHALERGITE
jgi:hypothetical protein